MPGEIRKVMITVIVNCKLSGVLMNIKHVLKSFIAVFMKFFFFFSLTLTSKLETYNNDLLHAHCLCG